MVSRGKGEGIGCILSFTHQLKDGLCVAPRRTTTGLPTSCAHMFLLPQLSSLPQMLSLGILFATVLQVVANINRSLHGDQNLARVIWGRISFSTGHHPKASHCVAPSAGAIRTTESPASQLAQSSAHNDIVAPRTNSISLCFLTVLTRGSWPSSSSSATNMVSSTSPSTRLQCESYA